VATIFSDSDESIALLSRKLLEGELVAVPTETVYGLAAVAFNPEACAKIFEVKERPSFDPLIVHLPIGFDPKQISNPSPLLAPLAEKFWPGPLTLVVEKKPIIPDIVTSGMDSVAIRMPRHPVFQRLLKKCGKPLAAPSANPFGYVSPTTAAHVEENLGDRISSILDGGPSEIGLESTILDIRNPDQPKILRPGSILKTDLEKVLNRKIFLSKTAPKKQEIMPGQTGKHYSPKTPSFLLDRIDPDEPSKNPKTAYLFFNKPESLNLAENVFWLSEKENLLEAGHFLFERLRQIDRAGFRKLIAEKVPNSGIGIAINDRLRRAAFRET